MTNHNPLCGALVVNKPSGPTSHDIVARVRVLSRTKVGHTGTLDPLASGVLPLLLGPATRLTRFFQSSDKEYLAEIQLGQTTDTLDGEGEVLQESPVPEVSPQQAEEVLSKFTGEIRQQPPMFSAVKVGGKETLPAGSAKARGGTSVATGYDSSARVAQTRKRDLELIGLLLLRHLHSDSCPRYRRSPRLWSLSSKVTAYPQWLL